MPAVAPIGARAGRAHFCIANWNLMAHLLTPLAIELEPAAKEFLPERWDE